MKKRMNRVLALALTLVMSLSLAACGGSKDSSTSAPSQDKTQEAAAAKTFKVGVCGRDFTSPFQTSLYESMEEAARHIRRSSWISATAKVTPVCR